MTQTESQAAPSLDALPLFNDGPATPELFDTRSAINSLLTQRAHTLANAHQHGIDAPSSEPNIDLWNDVDALAASITQQLADEDALHDLNVPQAWARGREIIDRTIREQRATMASQGILPWNATYEGRVRQALADKLFGLGRLQALVDDDDVENIEIIGYDQVTLIMADGRRQSHPPIAASDEDLIKDISFLAARRAHSERSFNPSNPFLSLSLPGGHRLQAAAWVTPRPRVSIRRHRLVDISLDDLVQLGEIDQTLCDFLAAAVRAHRSIVVSGTGQGSGKTTMVRALANAMDPDESIVTIETEYELFLHEMGERHTMVTPFEMRPGSGEVGPNGRPAGEIDVHELIFQSLRFNASRVIVGEVRGREVLGMFKAMQMGNGSLSTIHANSATDVIERLVTCAIEESSITEDVAYRQVAQHIDLVVYIDTEIDPTGRKHRFVREVIELGMGEGRSRVAVTNVFSPRPDGRAIPATPPSFLEDLVSAGLRGDAFASGRTTWPTLGGPQ